VPLVVLRAISSERGLDLVWRREVLKTSVRALLSVSVTGREGFNGNQNQQRAISSKRGIGYREEKGTRSSHAGVDRPAHPRRFVREAGLWRRQRRRKRYRQRRERKAHFGELVQMDPFTPASNHPWRLGFDHGNSRSPVPGCGVPAESEYGRPQVTKVMPS
jgi:hypothetical protein